MKLVHLRRSRLRCLFSALFSLLLIVGACDLPAQTKTNPPPSGNRWLLIVDTSRLMQRRAAATQQIAASLVNSGMNGQMRAGDTLGLWTFNESLYMGKFPLQDWTPETSRTIAQAVYRFLGAQKNEKDSRPESITENLNRVVKASELITVIIISDGSAPMQGTPYDDAINANYKTWEAQQRKSELPFLTVLRAWHGQYTNFVVSTPPFALELPPLPPPPVQPKVAEVKPQPVSPPPSLPPLILSGRKPGVISTQEVQDVEAPSQPETNREPAAPVVTAPPQNQSTQTVATSALPVVQTPSNSVAIGPEKTMPSEPETVATAPIEPVQKKDSDHKWIWITVAAGICVFAVISLLLRRSRNASSASLITRSLDRNQK